MTISNRRLYKCFRLQILIESGSKLFPSPDLTTHNSSDRSEWCNKCMHQYLGFPQIRPTAAACNYKHPQSPDQRRLPALPKSPDNPQPKSFVSPAPLFDASLSAINPTLLPLLLTSFPERLKTQDELYYPASTVQNIHNVPTASAVATSVQTTSLYSSTEKHRIPTPQTTVTSEKMTVFFFSSLPVPVFQWKYRVGRAEKPHITSVCVSTRWKIALFVF